MITYRQKTIVVPYARMAGNNHLRIFLFKDTKSGDWTFVSGGCKQKEDPYMCATRELFEESKKTLALSEMQNMSIFTFESGHRPAEHAKDDAKRRMTVVTRYVVFIVKTPYSTDEELADYRKRYTSSFVGKAKAFNETNDVVFVSPNELVSKKWGMWDFMQNEVVPKVMPYFVNGRVL